MQLQVDPGDLTIKKTFEHRGDTPAWTTLRGRLRIDGNVMGASGTAIDVFTLHRNGDDVQPGTSWRPHNRADQLVNWWTDPKFIKASATEDTKSLKDFQLRVFNPRQFLNQNSPPLNLSVDIAIGGIVYWEVDNNDGGGDQGMDPRKKIIEAVAELFKSTSDEYAKNITIPFNYKSYVSNPASSTAAWYLSFMKGLKAAINGFKGNLGETAVDVVRTKLEDKFNQFFTNSGSTDEITGIHLFVLIPVTADFYEGLQTLRQFGKKKTSDDPFGSDLITTIKMFNDDYYTKSSTWLTFGLVPNGTKASPSQYKRQLGATNSLYFRGGYNSFANGGLGWTDRSGEWTAPESGILAGPNIFNGTPPADPLYPQPNYGA